MVRNNLHILLWSFFQGQELALDSEGLSYMTAAVKPEAKTEIRGISDLSPKYIFRYVFNKCFSSFLRQPTCVVAKQLMHRLAGNELDNINQSAYKTGHSTETALLKNY